MIKRIAYTMYPVVDMARARQFYEQEIGLTASMEYANGQWVEYEPGGCFVLTTLAPVKPSTTFGANIAFGVDDVAALVARLKEKNYVVGKDVTETPGSLIAVVVDTEGNAVTLTQQK